MFINKAFIIFFKYLKGANCEQLKDWCLISGNSVCNNTKQQCYNLLPAQQTSSKQYQCCSFGFDSTTGTCSGN